MQINIWQSKSLVYKTTIAIKTNEIKFVKMKVVVTLLEPPLAFMYMMTVPTVPRVAMATFRRPT
jgi:hypothetical protein